jgi:hypothetical protein
VLTRGFCVQKNIIPAPGEKGKEGDGEEGVNKKPKATLPGGFRSYCADVPAIITGT